MMGYYSILQFCFDFQQLSKFTNFVQEERLDLYRSQKILRPISETYNIVFVTVTSIMAQNNILRFSEEDLYFSYIFFIDFIGCNKDLIDRKAL